MHSIAPSLLALPLALALSLSVQARPFVHPGMLHSREDLERMKSMVEQGREPWKSGWVKLQAAPAAKLTWTPHAVAVLEVASGGAAGTNQQDDAGAVQFHAIQWYVTGNEAHAKKAIEILNAWSAALKTMGGSNARLQCGITGFKFCNGAEILKHTYTGWPEAERSRFERMLLEVYYPVIKAWAPTFNGNWDAYMMLTMMSIGIFTDSAAIFDQAVDWYRNGNSNGAIGRYIFPTGQCQESTRDQMHVQMGLGALAGACETGYHQGLDMYGALDNRMLLGFEYSAKYNLGQSVPAVGAISPSGRGIFRPMWEIMQNHFVNRKGLAAPFIQQVVDKIRPEGYEQDYISLGTLLFHTGGGVPVLRPLRRERPLDRLVIDALGRRTLRLEGAGPDQAEPHRAWTRCWGITLRPN